MTANKLTIGKWETAVLVINGILAHLLLVFPKNVLNTTGTSGWILILYLSLLAAILLILILKLYSPFEGMDILDMSLHTVGNFGKIVVGLITTIFFLIIGALMLREYTENLQSMFFSSSPIRYLLIFFITAMAAGAYFGLEPIIRFQTISFPIILVSYFVVLISVYPMYDFMNFFPLLGNGSKSILKGGIVHISLFAPLINLFLLFPFNKSLKISRSAGYTALVVSSIMMSAFFITYLAVFPYPESASSLPPIFRIARVISYGRFFQRLESVFLIGWLLSALMYLSTILFFAAYLFKKTFGLIYYRPVILPFSIIIFYLSLLPSDLANVAQWQALYLGPMTWTIVFIIPLLLLIIARLKGIHNKGEKKP